MKIIDRAGGRKAFLVFWFGNFAGLLTAMDKMDGGEFVTIITLLVAAFVTGNVYEAVKVPQPHTQKQQ